MRFAIRRTVQPVAALLAILCLATPASAQTGVMAEENGRYSMTPTDGGFLRLDTRTGSVTLCTTSKETVQCRTAPEERQALEQEIGRLAKENAELKTRLAGAPAARPSVPLPNREDMDRALGFAESFMRRMMRIMREETPPDRT